MNIEELITDLRARVNPQYYDQVGTESYERHQCVLALESLLARIDVLREENERLAGCVNKLKVERAWAIREVKRLTEENERLRKDAERLDEINAIAQREEGADMHLAHGHIALYLRTGIGSNTHGVRGPDIRKVIDAARGAK